MSLEVFDAEALMDMDGGEVREAINHHLDRASLDCRHRSFDKRARKVTMTVEFRPQIDAQGKPMEEAEILVKFKSSVPDHVSRTLSASIRRDGKLAFNPDSPRNVGQMTIPMGDAE